MAFAAHPQAHGFDFQYTQCDLQQSITAVQQNLKTYYDVQPNKSDMEYTVVHTDKTSIEMKLKISQNNKTTKYKQINL